jgi:hypothetical protein
MNFHIQKSINDIKYTDETGIGIDSNTIRFQKCKIPENTSERREISQNKKKTKTTSRPLLDIDSYCIWEVHYYLNTLIHRSFKNV